MNRLLAAILLALGASGTTACACARPCPPRCAPVAAAATTSRPATTAAPAPRWPQVGQVLDHRTEQPVAFEALVDRLATVPVVYVGEQHDQQEHHRFQARVLEALAARPGGPLALGLEMFYRPQQPHLDAYVRGEIDEATMLERTEWKTRWGFGWEMYAPMLRFCRERKIPVLALNAEKEITRTVSRKGLEALTPAQREAMPTLDLSDQAHRAFVKEAFGTHGDSMPTEAFERFYTAMVIWDDTMADTVAAWLVRGGEGARIVVVAGNGHIADRFGIPARAARRSGKPYLTVLSRVVPPTGAEGAEEGPGRMDVTYADYSAWFSPSPAEKPPAPKKVLETPPAPAPDAATAPAATKTS